MSSPVIVADLPAAQPLESSDVLDLALTQHEIRQFRERISAIRQEFLLDHLMSSRSPTPHPSRSRSPTSPSTSFVTVSEHTGISIHSMISEGATSSESQQRPLVSFTVVEARRALRRLLAAIDDFLNQQPSSLRSSLAPSPSLPFLQVTEHSDRPCGVVNPPLTSGATAYDLQSILSVGPTSGANSDRWREGHDKHSRRSDAQARSFERSSAVSLSSLPPSQRQTFRETRSVHIRHDDDGNKFINEYAIIGLLGRGAQGKVKLAEHTVTKKLVAIKILSKSATSRWWRASQIRRDQRIGNEIEIMKRLKHRNVVELYEVIDDPQAHKMYLIMQYVARGPICQVQPDGTCRTLPESEVVSLIRQAITGLRYLHRHGVVHRDVKPENMLVDLTGRLCLSDFGVAEIFETGEDPMITGTIGTPLFFAPEMFLVGEERIIGTAVDVWALGVTAFLLLFGYAPFRVSNSVSLDGPPLRDVIQKRRPEIPNGTSAIVCDFFEQIFEKDPQKRVSLQQLKCHLWLRRRRTTLTSPSTFLRGEVVSLSSPSATDENSSTNAFAPPNEDSASVIFVSDTTSATTVAVADGAARDFRSVSSLASTAVYTSFNRGDRGARILILGCFFATYFVSKLRRRAAAAHRVSTSPRILHPHRLVAMERPSPMPPPTCRDAAAPRALHQPLAPIAPLFSVALADTSPRHVPRGTTGSVACRFAHPLSVDGEFG